MVASFEDRQDFEDAERGRIDALDPCVVRAADGRVVWNLEAYSYLDGECPDTVNPSLWRQAQLCAKQGLFEVTRSPASTSGSASEPRTPPGAASTGPAHCNYGTASSLPR